MRILSLKISGFRGIQELDLRLTNHTALVGPNGSGKSTVVDALSLVFGRTRLLRELTEHDFYGSSPTPAARFKIVVTLGGFSGNNPDLHQAWFRDGRGIPKWWNSTTGQVASVEGNGATELCVQVGLVGRFDHEDLTVETLRYFHDSDDAVDVFNEDGIQAFPNSLLGEIGYYVLPARRTWESTISFNSELFRKAVTSHGGIPSASVLAERDRLRQPTTPLEVDPTLSELVARINAQLQHLMPTPPNFQLRLTSTDSDSLLKALIPHYGKQDIVSLPIARQGTGLISLQTFILLLEVGRKRIEEGLSFILALEEPELHIPPGLQRRLIAQAIGVANQTLCTSHSPILASFYRATDVQVLDSRQTQLVANPLLLAPLTGATPNGVRKLYQENRGRVIEALMHSKVLIPEGRGDFEWLRLLMDVAETGEHGIVVGQTDLPPLSVVAGVIPTHDSQVDETHTELGRLRSGLVVLVDGDAEGDIKVQALLQKLVKPEAIVQWPAGLMIEDAIIWILSADAGTLPKLMARIQNANRVFTNLAELRTLMSQQVGAGKLKGDYLAYEEIASIVGEHIPCIERVRLLLNALTRVCIGPRTNGPNLVHDPGRSVQDCTVLRVIL